MDQINPASTVATTGRLRAAFPSYRQLLFGAPCWGVAMASSALSVLYLRNGLLTSHLPALMAVYFFGGALAWPFTLPLARLLAHRRPLEARFAAFFLALSLGTVAMTAFLFALDYRWFYARWHAPFGTLVWAFQFAFTSASALYQFAILGLGLFLPFGFIFLVMASLYLARHMR
ncbi:MULTISPECIES: hypothetical protein [unclassified Rhizobium]|uniref:hypothetical protein n=1 Tax=unclassified Rhizobium TaxID=2613769 RepID=UPI000CF2B667|nr:MULTISPECIES: hypothetical protein [Rhizobium]MDK4737647.1 hypothetical protein [Rhizobium sp. CNPSo 3464]UWU22783.1 hypothetical protein N2601_07495 [Rhizobium tropici]